MVVLTGNSGFSPKAVFITACPLSPRLQQINSSSIQLAKSALCVNSSLAESFFLPAAAIPLMI